jgi:acetylornithine/succinyldiaminopimelate/putrescine aminotransferase
VTAGEHTLRLLPPLVIDATTWRAGSRSLEAVIAAGTGWPQ